MILPCISNRIRYEGIVLWILVQSDSVIDLILFAGHCDIFHGPVILPCISDSINYEGVILWILVKSGTVNNLILFAGHCDLYFMVQ